MLWSSVVSYFPDSSKIATIYAVTTLSILKEPFDQIVKCMQDINAALKADMDEVCENRILYSYLTKLGYYHE